MALNPDVYSDPTGTSTKEFFAKKVNGFQLLAIFTESSVLDFWLGSECASSAVNYFHKQLYKEVFYSTHKK